MLNSVSPTPSDLINQLFCLPSDFHKAGTATPNLLKAIIRNCGYNIDYSLETGSGLTTLLFSQLCRKNHKVFAIEGDNNSITAVRQCGLLNPKVVEFIIAPTQLSLPRHEFTDKLDIALLDGPHGFPFPHLEYYYIYPHIREGGILIIDDIHIPSIQQLYCFLKEDDMFKFIEVADNAAFFRRNNTPLFDPLGDGWWLQGFNKKKFPVYPLRKKIFNLFNSLRPPPIITEIIPPAIKNSIKTHLGL